MSAVSTSRASTNGAARVDVAVVGAGVVGLGVALAAVRRGLRVVVLERGSEASGASIRNFGHLCATPQTGLARSYAQVAREVWLDLARDAGVWMREQGTLVVARAADELALLEEFAASRARDGAPDEVVLLTARELEQRAPVAPGLAVGGALLPLDLQANPRQALGAITAHLAGRGVDLRFRTAVGAVEPGLVRTARGEVRADQVVVAVNHDIDLLFPEVAGRVGIVRCALDMLRVEAPLRMPLPAPLLTGWSLVRYGGFVETSAAVAVRDRLRAERPDLAALDLNQMYTQLPDGTLIVGDTHARGETVSPFQVERTAELMLAETAELFGLGAGAMRVVERWQGVYASGPDDYLDVEVAPGVHLAAATTGIGMTTGFGLAEAVVARFADGAQTEPTTTTTTDQEARILA
ncbi:TIGR03364 family FAD-dependent oxidoreductase [Agromyces intestinalis]|uniref:TIGR03364 family FAD-dependent oxidoreductase n=1 Tax=Agromyces intestinalis TaxID=2592652 RepID=A0A5C1YEE9_9MICO|nr:TIGR03364 family FAD-dependent oxidoreductase [Agromyces intestinalis]QEO14453.1 TIGR03364 family FAD-dependent oxidoreductase [Agromyces intestinalis]